MYAPGNHGAPGTLFVNAFLQWLQDQRDLFLILLGAAIAVLSPALVDGVSRRRQAQRVKKVLLVELHEVRYRLVLVAGQMRYEYGVADRGFMQWEVDALMAYQGPNRIPEADQLFSQVLAYSDQELNAAMEIKRQRANSIGENMKHYRVPHLDAHLHVLSDLSQELQIALLDFKHYLDLYNAEVDTANNYFALTFTLEGENHAIAKANLRQSYRNIADMALRLVVKADCAIKLIDQDWQAPPPPPNATAGA